MSLKWRSKGSYILAVKKNGNCTRCGISDYRCLTFHHTGKNKEFSIGTNAAGFSLAELQEEIKKCILLCANCHYIVHWEENKKKEGVIK